jgi:hypothetical protein
MKIGNVKLYIGLDPVSITLPQDKRQAKETNKFETETMET